LRRFSLFLSPDAPAGAAAPAPPAIPPATPERRADLYLDRLLQRHGTAEAALRAVSVEKFTAEDLVAAHEATIKDLRGKIPAEGSIVLPKAEAATFAALKALGTPEEITAKVKRAGDLETTVAQSALDKLAREAATVSGLDPEAFAAHAAAKGLHIEMKDGQVVEKGKAVTKKLPHVRPADDEKAPLVALSEYTSKLPAYDQRALQAVATDPAPTGTAWPAGQQPTAPVTTSGDKVGDYITKLAERGKAKPHPLIPARPAQPVGATP
jgi:hypothetical protein